MNNAFEVLSYEEQKEVVELFSCWLKQYSHEVVNHVMEKSEEILKNEFSMNLLRELKKREEEEDKDFLSSIRMRLTSFEEFKEFNPHNHPITHSNSYRDVLYDMYIRR